jgi:hypothetical protein
MKLSIIFQKKASRNKPESYFHHRLVELASLLLSTAGFVIIIINLIDTRGTIRSNIDLNMNNWSFEIDKVFIAHPECKKYFNDSVPIYSSSQIKDHDTGGLTQYQRNICRIKPDTVSDTFYAQVKAVSDLMIDCFDGVLGNRQYFVRSDREYWIKWFYNNFNRSPILCKTLAETEDEFGDEIKELFKQWRNNKRYEEALDSMKMKFYK